MSEIIIGTVTGREIKKNRDGDDNVLMLQCTMQEDEDVQSVELITQAGEDTNPPNDSSVVIVDAGDAYKIGVAVDDGIEPSMNEGEKKLYSSSGGAIKAFVNLLSSGVIELNGNGGNAVKYAELNTGLQNMATAINAELTKIATAINAIVPGSYTPTPVTVDVSASEVAEVKLK